MDPTFLEGMIVKPQQTYPVTLGGKAFDVSLTDIIYDTPKGNFPHPNTMTCKLMASHKPVTSWNITLWAAVSSNGRAISHPRKGSRNMPMPR